MCKECRFLNLTYDVAWLNLVTIFDGWFEVPLFISVQTGHFRASSHESTFGIIKVFERSLDSVINAFDQTGAKLNAKLFFGINNQFARADTAGFFINLYRGEIAIKLNYLADKVCFTDSYHVVHSGACHSFGLNYRAGDFYDLALSFFSHYQNLYLIVLQNINTSSQFKCLSKRLGSIAL